ncbi:hypothetical protein [Actinokineospora pegani]|uniref:hypothetical protein n=1 Tax=Actinokineospora pegani TaxID=2654637 RepID=UPI0018D3619F|nr:hypothetical protein [Actinokineospora pegani]
MRKLPMFLAGVLGAYLVLRAIAEPFVIDVFDPATYRDDWGGPGLAGVLAVHCGPGVLAAIGFWWARRRSRRRSESQVEA